MRRPIEETVSRCIQSRFPGAGAARLDADTPLFSSGVVDSFGVLELIAFLEERFRIDIDLARHELSEFDTVAKIVAFVERRERPGEAS